MKVIYLRRQQCQLQLDEGESDVNSCSYWLLNADFESNGQHSFANGIRYYNLVTSFYLSESRCSSMSHLCLLNKETVSEVIDLESKVCIEVVNGEIYFPSTRSVSESECWNLANGSACVKKHLSPIFEDNSILRFCSKNRLDIRPIAFEWKPKMSRKLFSGVESDILVNFSLVNIRESFYALRDGFTIQLLLSDQRESTKDLVRDVAPLAHSNVISLQVSSFISGQDFDVGASLHFISIPVKLLSFSSEVCKKVSHVGLAAYTQNKNLLNPASSIVTWSVFDQNSAECDCAKMDFNLNKFYTTEYLLFGTYADEQRVVPYHAVIKYNLAGSRRNYFSSNEVRNLLMIELVPVVYSNNTNAFEVISFSVEKQAFFNKDVSTDQEGSDIDCSYETGSLYISGTIFYAPSKGLARKDMLYGKYNIVATVNKIELQREIDETNNIVENEIVIYSFADYIQLVSAASFFKFEANYITLEIDMFVQYTKQKPRSFFAGVDLIEANAYFGNVSTESVFSGDDKTQVLTLHSASDCGVPTSNAKHGVEIGEFFHIRRQFYASTTDISDLACAGFHNLVVAVQRAPIYGGLKSDFSLENNAVEIKVPEAMKKCLQEIPAAQKRLLDKYVIPLHLFIKMPVLESYIIADNNFQNELVAVLYIQTASSLNPELLQLYLDNLDGENTLTVFATFTLTQQHCFAEPCPSVEFNPLMFTFNATRLVLSPKDLDSSHTFQWPFPFHSDLCGWNKVSWKFEIGSTDRKVIAFKQSFTGCPQHLSEVFVLCPQNSLAVTSFSQEFPPVQKFIEPNVFPKVQGEFKNRVYSFKLSAAVTSVFSDSTAYSISLCEDTRCNSTSRNNGVQVALRSLTVVTDTYPLFSNRVAGIPGITELVKIEGKLEIDYQQQDLYLEKTIKVPFFIILDPMEFKYFGSLIISPTKFSENKISGIHGFQVNSFSFFQGEAIKKSLSGNQHVTNYK